MHNGLKFRDANDKWVSVSATDPLPTAGGGGGGSSVTVSNFPATQAVSGPLTNAQLTAVTGTSATATVIGLLKGILTALNTIAANTAPTP